MAVVVVLEVMTAQQLMTTLLVVAVEAVGVLEMALVDMVKQVQQVGCRLLTILEVMARILVVKVWKM
jgi:hypothetical protein